MESVYLLFLGIGLMTTGVSSTKTTLRYFKDGRTWHDAQTTCSSNNGKLMIPDATTLGRLTQACPIAMNETVWVGEYTSLSEWIEIIGCYEDWNTASSLQYTTNDPLLCVHLCQNYTYFGMKEDKCICIDQTIYNTVTKTKSQNCSNSCTGRTDVFCGGTASVNIYRKVNRQITEEPKTNCTRIDCFCVSADCQTIGNQLQTAYFSRPCSNDLTTVCDNYESVTGDAPSWKEAIQRCVEQQNSYPVNSESSTSLCNKTSITWTSIFRDVFIAIDNTGLPLSNIQGCKRMDLTKSSSGSSLGNCTEQLPFVCEIVLKPGQSEDICVPTTTPIPTTETMTSTTSDITTSTMEPTSSSSSSQDTARSTTTLTRTTAGPLPGPSAQTGPVIGASVAAVIILLLIVCVVIILMRRKRTKDESFVTYGNDNKPYIENPVVGNSNRNMGETTGIKTTRTDNNKYQNQELVVPVKPETSTVEGQVTQNEVENLSVRTTDENKMTESVHSKNEEIESKLKGRTMINNRDYELIMKGRTMINNRDYELIKKAEDVEKNVLHQHDNVSDANNTNQISVNISKPYNEEIKNEKAETIAKVTEKQTIINQGGNTNPSTAGGTDTTSVGARTNYVQTGGDGKSYVNSPGSDVKSNVSTIGGAGTSHITTTVGAGTSHVTTTGGAGTSHVTTIGGAGTSHVTTIGGAGTSHVTTTGGPGTSHVTTIGGAGTSHVTTIGGAGTSHVTTTGGPGTSHITTTGGAGTSHITTIGGPGTSHVKRSGEQQNSVGDIKNNVMNPGVDARNKPLNIDKPTPGSHTSVINIKM